MRALLRVLVLAVGFAALWVVWSPRAAFGEAPGPRTPVVHVLGIDSDDAEDQADALTGALRSRVRSAPGWSLQETQHTLGMLTAALRCPPKPDTACLLRIGDQLHTDRFVWGVMSKAPGNQVMAEVHLWARGRPDAFDKETYSDNLQDQNDETLRKIATRILDKISGTVTTGTLSVHAGDAAGVVWINGQKNRALDHGAATIALAPGRYDVEVRSEGFATAKEDGVIVASGQDTSVAVKLEPAPPPVHETETAKAGSGSTGRMIAGWTLVGGGVVAGIIAGVYGIEFISAKSDLDSARQQVPSQITDVCSSTNQGFTSQPAAQTACNKYNTASNDRTLGIVFGSVGVVAVAVGTVLLLTMTKENGDAGAGSTAHAEPTQLRLVRLLPYLSPESRGGAVGGLDLALTF